MKLSILIPSLYERKAVFVQLLDILMRQATKDVEILVNIDGRMKTTGRKRHELLQAAQGEYVCFIDDDDMVPDDYVLSILNALESEPDCVGFWGEIVHQNLRKKVHYAIGNETRQDNDVFYRPIWTMNPVRREIAAKVVFPDKTVQEDAAYVDQIKPHLHSSVFIDKVLYTYRCRNAF